MAVTNSLAPKEKDKKKFSVAVQEDTYKKLINTTLGDPKQAAKFIAAVSSAVAVNPLLQDCEAGSILSTALLGETLQLSPSPQLGQYYMVPFDCAEKGPDGKTLYQKDANGNILTDKNGRWLAVTVKKAQFVLGYRGFLQLAIRSGYYKKINVLPLKEGELVSFDPLFEEYRINVNQGDRDSMPTTGYIALFEYTNGFRKTIYWTREKMLHHASTYSKAFNAEMYGPFIRGEIPKKDLWQYSSLWYKDFDSMAMKTMLRQLISKWGIMSVELQTAYEKDMAVLKENGDADYVDNVPDDMPETPAAPAQPEPQPKEASNPVEQPATVESPAPEDDPLA